MPRIIAGTLGGRGIPSPPTGATRPTSDRVREALFSRLEGWGALAGARVLDLYAGTGALAFESLSRGADSALLVERHAATARALGRSARDLGLAEQVEIRQASAEQSAAQLAREAATVDGRHGHGDRFALVFLDPPYDVPTDRLEELLVTLRGALVDDALVVIERSTRSRPISWPEGWTKDDSRRYGETLLEFGGPDERAIPSE